jgi:hypothetical protein
MLTLLLGCATQTPKLGLRLTADLVGQPAGAFASFPAVSMDGSRMLAVDVSADGETRIIQFETRDGEALGQWRLRHAEERPADRIIQARVEKADWDLSARTWLTMVELHRDPRVDGQYSGHGMLVRYDGTGLVVERNELEALFRQQHWEVVTGGETCDVTQPSCVCRNAAAIAGAWVGVDQREALLRIEFVGDERCPAPLPRFEVLKLPKAPGVR